MFAGGHRGTSDHPHVTIPGTIPEESLGNSQVVPDIPPSKHSYGNQTTSFMQSDQSPRTPDVTNPFQKMIDRAYGPVDNGKNSNNSKFTNGTNTGPRVKFADAPKTKRYDRAPLTLPKPPKQTINSHGYHSYMDTDDTRSDCSTVSGSTEAAQYSCADMSVTLKTKTPPSTVVAKERVATGSERNGASLSGYDDDDATTTTSGSYVVDPEDLCNEIDDLFFKDMAL